MLVAAMVMPSTAWAEESTVTFTAKEGTAGFSESENYDKLIDGKYTSEDGTKWCLSFLSEGAYIIFSASERIQLTGYSIVTGNDNASNASRNPKSWKIYGCNDESAGRSSESWVLIDQKVEDTDLQDLNYQKYDFTLSNPPSEKYQYFKMEITATKGASVLQMSELILTYTTCDHQWVKTDDVVAPTCTETGYDVYKCSLCQLTKNVANDNSALGHLWVSGTVVAPTCTKDGYTPQTCSRCQAEQKINIVNATGHEWGTDDICDVCGAGNSTPSKPQNGDGSAENPFQIGTVGELYWFAGLVNGDASVCTGDVSQKGDACAVLTKDIIVNEGVFDENGNLSSNTSDFTSWKPISPEVNYSGTFDGDNHTISGLYYNVTSSDTKVDAGLFGRNAGTIKNVSVKGSYFKLNFGGEYCLFGILCGFNAGTIENFYNESAITLTGTVGSQAYFGGICGDNGLNGIIKDCNNVGKVSSEASSTPGINVGGVCGINSSGTIENSSNTGEVSGTYNVGGVCGYNLSGSRTATITSCYNEGKVSGTYNVGGVCGYNQGKSSVIAEITNCYNKGTVSGTDNVGGVCGDNKWYATITECYNEGKVSGTDNVGGVCGYNDDMDGVVGLIIKNSYNKGEVSGNNRVGGVCGYNYAWNSVGVAITTIENCYSTNTVSGTKNVGGVCGSNVNGDNNDQAIITNCYYDSDIYTGSAVGGDNGIVSNTEGKSTKQFVSGEVCYLLNGEKSKVTDESSLVWYQNIDNGAKDNYPLLDSSHGTVYQCNPCTAFYSNTEGATKDHNHVNDGNGFLTCTACGDKRFQEATQNASGEYEIGNAGQLCWFAGLVNGTLNDGTQQNTTAKGVLTGNIDLASVSNWTPIGNASNMFGGTFDGKNFKVQHLSITQQGDNTGLFGYASGATIQNICIDGNITLNTTSYTEGYGSIAGRMDNSTISNCHSSMNFSIESEMEFSTECIGHIGGIVGKMHEANCAVQGCSYSGVMNLGNNNVKVAAGIVGYATNNKVPITNCRFTGTIKSKYTGALYMGGIFGYTNSSGEVKVTNCLQAGTLEKDGNSSLTGMLIGQINNGYGANAVTNNYYISGTFNVIGTTTGTPTTKPATQCSTEQLQSGEICYLLNGSSPDGGWGQQIGTDGYPVPGSDKTVYEVNLLCGGVKAVGKTYANSNKDVTIPHELPETASFNSEKTIYDKVCQRCGETLYYANAAGTIEATPDAEVTEFTVANYPLQDATTYDNKAVFTATNFIYTRKFNNTNWTTWYVPFDLTLTAEICAKYDFSRINNVHQYDTDNDGTADKTVVESFRQMPGVTLKANYPYLVKPVSEGDLNMMLPLEGVKPALAETNSIDCQSVDFSYTFTGTYTAMGEGGSSYYDPYTLWTDGTWQHFQSLAPMRHYLTVTPRNPFFASAASLRSIMLSVIGDEGTTGIVNMYSDERKAAETYDLGGRRLPAGASQKGVMIENGKVIIKK